MNTPDNPTNKVFDPIKDHTPKTIIALIEAAKLKIDKASNMTEIANIINTFAVSIIDNDTYALYKSSSDLKEKTKILSNFYRSNNVYSYALELIKYTPKRFHNTTIYKDLLETYSNLN